MSIKCTECFGFTVTISSFSGGPRYYFMVDCRSEHMQHSSTINQPLICNCFDATLVCHLTRIVYTWRNNWVIIRHLRLYNCFHQSHTKAFHHLSTLKKISHKNVFICKNLYLTKVRKELSPPNLHNLLCYMLFLNLHNHFFISFKLLFFLKKHSVHKTYSIS